MLDPDVRGVLDGTSHRPPRHRPARRQPPLGAGLDRHPRRPHRDPHRTRLSQGSQPAARPTRGDLADPATTNPFRPVIVRGRVVEWLEGDAAWEIVDRIAQKYIGSPYPRGEERVVMLIEPGRQIAG